MLLLAAAGSATLSLGHAQDDPNRRDATIEALYPVMIAALDAKQFGRARNICDQVILWEPQNPVHHYNLACIEAQAGGARLAYAFGALELAAALGFSDLEHLQADPDLHPLRTEPRFAEVVRRVAHNANAGEVLDGLAFPPKRSSPSAANPAEPPAGQPAPPAISAGIPVGLYWMNRYDPVTRALEQTVWYFAPGRAVYRNLEHGYSPADLASHRGPRGLASAEDRTLHIRWQDGGVSSGLLEVDQPGFIWDRGIFAAIAPFDHAEELVGSYAGGSFPERGDAPAVIPPRLSLRSDGSFSWEGVAFSRSSGEAEGRLESANHASAGRWELRDYSLTLKADSGITLRRFVFPDDDDRTVVKPDRLFVGGFVLKRQP